MGALAPLADDNSLRPFDDVICGIVDYVYDYTIRNSHAWDRSKLHLLDALGAACESVATSDCGKMLGPHFPNPSETKDGFRLPGTNYQLDVMKGAFDMGSMIRYLDHNDAFPGAEWGHPSDNLGAILPVADILSRHHRLSPDGDREISMADVLAALIKAYEIQGCFQIRNAFNQVGLDHVILVKIASTAVVSWLIRLPKPDACAALSHAWIDGHPLRVYRQAPNAGPRKGWAAGDACMRAVHLALLVKHGQPGAPTALSCPRWGFADVLFHGRAFDLPRPFGTWVVETALFKVNTAEGHGMTAVEAALRVADELRARGLHPAKDVRHVRVRTTQAAMTIINKHGVLHNAADRDHCLKYMCAVVLLKGAMVETEDYQDRSPWAWDPRVEALRQRMVLEEDPQFTRDYFDPAVRSLANALQVTLADGTGLPDVVVEFPQGHFRRAETPRLIVEKAERNLALRLPTERVREIMERVEAPDFADMRVRDFIDLFALGSSEPMKHSQ